MIRVLTILGLLCLCHVPTQAADTESVTLPETKYDFGTVKQGSKVVHRFHVKNSTTTPLTITSVQLSICGMDARFRPVVEPGNEGAITVEWDTSHWSGEMEGSATVFFAGSSARRQMLLLKAVVQPPVEILPYPAIFLSAFHGEDKEARLRIVNHEARPLALSLPVSGGKHFVSSLATIVPGKIYELVTTIRGGTLPGHYDEELQLLTDNPNFSRVTIPVQVFAKSDVYANPETIDFGTVSLGNLQRNSAVRDLMTQTLLVKKRSGVFEIKKVESNLDTMVVVKDPANGKSATYRIDVGLKPEIAKPGPIAGFVELITDESNFPVIRVPITGLVQP